MQANQHNYLDLQTHEVDQVQVQDQTKDQLLTFMKTISIKLAMGGSVNDTNGFTFDAQNKEG